MVAYGNFFDSAVSLTPLSQFEFKYLGELEVKSENAVGCETVTLGKMFDEKKRGKKSRETVPLRRVLRTMVKFEVPKSVGSC